MLVSKATLKIIPKNDVILPSVSSKVVKYLILSGQLLTSLKELVESKDKNKPLFISNLRLNKKRLISLGDPIKIRAGTILSGDVGFITNNQLPTDINNGEFKTPYGEFEVYMENIRLFNIQTNFNDKDKMFLIKFVTPTLLSSKILIPPSLTDKYKKVKVGLSLLPSIGLIVGSSYREYVSILGKSNAQEYAERGFKISVLANAFSKVYGFNLKPVTAIIGKDEKENLRKVRGVVGWIKFDIVHKMKKNVWKYLTVASYLGLGRSRGIGFGEIEFSTIPYREGEKEEQMDLDNLFPKDGNS